MSQIVVFVRGGNYTGRQRLSWELDFCHSWRHSLNCCPTGYSTACMKSRVGGERDLLFKLFSLLCSAPILSRFTVDGRSLPAMGKV
jgi:hypothetical protein